jgi:OOP family OmpA-OmpF porin
MLPATASAMSLAFPAGAVQTARILAETDSYEFAVGVYSDGRVPKVPAEGAVISEAWRTTDGAFSTLQIMDFLRQQLIDAGFEISFECETDQCGGFDFRYQLDLLPEPEMHVDLGDFRYLAAQRLGPEPEYISLVVSRGGQSGFIQVTQVGQPGADITEITASTKSPDVSEIEIPHPSGPIAEQLVTLGRAPLEDLTFRTGSSQLSDTSFGSLIDLATWLKANPDMRVTLVGHTDATGTLASNLALSKKRAASVMQRLIKEYGVPASQLEASGVGYLMPRASNLTKEGRDKNRRVEVILTSTR